MGEVISSLIFLYDLCLFVCFILAHKNNLYVLGIRRGHFPPPEHTKGNDKTDCYSMIGWRTIPGLKEVHKLNVDIVVFSHPKGEDAKDEGFKSQKLGGRNPTH